MSHTQQQFLCLLASTRMKEKPVEENAVLFPSETKKQTYLFIFN